MWRHSLFTLHQLTQNCPYLTDDFLFWFIFFLFLFLINLFEEKKIFLLLFSCYLKKIKLHNINWYFWWWIYIWEEVSDAQCYKLISKTKMVFFLKFMFFFFLMVFFILSFHVNLWISYNTNLYLSLFFSSLTPLRGQV